MAVFLFLNSFYYPNIGGGAEIIMQLQAEELVRMGHSVNVLTTSDYEGLTVDIVNEVKVYRAGLKNVYWHYSKSKPSKLKRLFWHWNDKYNIKMQRYIEDVLKLENPDIVFCHNLAGWSSSVYDTLSDRKIPIIQVLHDQYWVCPTSNKFSNGRVCQSQCLKCMVFRFNHRQISSKASAVIGVSEFILKSLQNENYFKSVPGFVIHNAREIVPVIKDVQIRHSLKIGFIGTIVQVKGVELLIKAFTEINEEYVELIIAGNGSSDYIKYLKDTYQDTRISYLGFVNSIEFYRSVDVLVVPSLWPDTFPGVVFEGLASSLPVIGANIGGIPEMIIDGYNGILFEVGNQSSLRDAILSLIKNERLLREMSENSRDSVSSLISVSRMMRAYIDVCKEIGVNID